MPRFSDLLGGGDPADEQPADERDDAVTPDDATRQLPVADSSDHLDRLAGMAASRTDGESDRHLADEAMTAEVVGDDGLDPTVAVEPAGLAGLAPVEDDLLPSKKGRS